MGRSPCCDHETGLKKGPWTPEEDQKLAKHIQKHGHGSWRALPKLAGLNRCGKSCRLRWTNYLRPDIKRGKFSEEEEQKILHLHSILGNKWSAIAANLPGRTDNEIKNFWNTHLKKKLIQMGFDPMTHRPRTDIFSSLPHLIALASLKELVDQHSWEELQAARMQTEAAQMAKLHYFQLLLQPNINSSSFSSNNMSHHDIETYNLLSSLSSLNNDINIDIPVPNALDSIQANCDNLGMQSPFSRMPDLKTPCNFTPNLNKEIDQQVSRISSTSAVLPTDPPLVTNESSITNAGDACSTSSYGGPTTSYWSDLLLDHDTLFNAFA